jgi:LCP family protein required for cell wall assembly
MAEEEKPYRVYRARRGKSKTPLPSRGGLLGGAEPGAGGLPGQPGTGAYRGPGAARKPAHWGRRIGLGVALLVVLLIAWGVFGWLSFSSGVSDANVRLDAASKAALSPQSGLLYSHSTTILLLGTDNADNNGRKDDEHSDSIMLMRTDPARHRIYYLSIPRDIEVPIPGNGTQKINAAMQIGGSALAIKTIRAFVGIPINHVVVVNFADFKELIDRLGGITIDVPRPILSDRFDCPYKTEAECLKWQGWRFAKGPQHMSGERALIYSRVRVNQLDPSESDVTRGARQQAVMQAVLSKFVSPSVLLDLPFNGGSLVKPLTTDMSAGELAQFAWVKFRASTGGSIHCRLGGDFGGGGNGAPSEDNPATVAMFLGVSAPQPPTSTFGPGCVAGHTLQ